MKSFYKYIIEVFVIIFSILAAFWLDEYRENLNNREREQNYYKLLLKDIDKAENHINLYQLYIKLGNENITKLKNYKSREIDLEQLEIIQSYCGVNIMKERHNFLESFETIKFNGDLRIIQNQKIIETYYVLGSLLSELNFYLDSSEDFGKQYLNLLRSKFPGLLEICITGSLDQVDNFNSEQFIQDQEIWDTILLMEFGNQYFNQNLDSIQSTLSDLKNEINREF